jgi:hypothetical protein
VLVPGAQVGRCGELGEGARSVREPGEPVELDEEVAVGGEDERDVQALADTVELALLQPVRRRQVLALASMRRPRPAGCRD